MVVGDVEVTPIVDAVGRLAPYAEAYPSVPAEVWEQYRSLYPDLFAGDEWRLPCTSYLLRSDGTTVLVDTGVGPPGLWDWEPEFEGELAELVDPDEIDVVFLTHPHIDHIGWNTDADGMRFFPRARYVVHTDALAQARTREHPHIIRCVLPLLDVFETIDGEGALAPNVVVFPLPGHYPGHMGLRIGAEATILGDLAVHPALLDEPLWRYEWDFDQDLSAKTRAAFIPKLVDSEQLVVCGHYFGGGIGHVVTHDGRTVWEPVA